MAGAHARLHGEIKRAARCTLPRPGFSCLTTGRGACTGQLVPGSISLHGPARSLLPRCGFSNSVQVLSSFQTEERKRLLSGCPEHPCYLGVPVPSSLTLDGPGAEARGATCDRPAGLGRRDETPRYPGPGWQICRRDS